MNGQPHAERSAGEPHFVMRDRDTGVSSRRAMESVRQSSARFDRLRLNIIANFRERMQLRRSLVELEATNVQNQVEIEKRQATIATLEAELELGSDCDVSDLDELLDFEKMAMVKRKMKMRKKSWRIEKKQVRAHGQCP